MRSFFVGWPDFERESLANRSFLYLPYGNGDRRLACQFILQGAFDAKDFGAHVSRINFAPKLINSIETNFQNATIHQLCNYPYVIFVALQDIAPGEEIWASYGPYYSYDKFMYVAEVRDFFCGLLKTDCSEEYSFDP